MTALTLALVGDVLVNRPQPASAFDHVRELLQRVDGAIGSHVGIASGTSDIPAPVEAPLLVQPHMLEALRGSGLRAMACANKYMVDGGHAILIDTLECMRSAGVVTAGAGMDLNAARAPGVFEAKGQRVGVLAYTSCFTKGYEARNPVPPIPAVPGIAPLRAATLYQPLVPNMWLPGYDPSIRVVHWPTDLADLERDVAAAASKLDVVIVAAQQRNLRLGPVGVDEYERVAARRAIDAGAKAFFAAHHHSLRGAELYKGAPIFYGLGNFVFDLPKPNAGVLAEFGPQATNNQSAYPFPDYCRHTAIAVLMIQDTIRAALVPATIGEDGAPRPLSLESDGGRNVREYFEKCMRAVGSSTQLSPSTAFVSGIDVLELLPS